MLATGLGLPYYGGIIGVDLGADAIRFTNSFMLNVRLTGNIAHYSDIAGGAQVYGGIDAKGIGLCVNLTYQVYATFGTFGFFLGPAVGYSEESFRILYSADGSGANSTFIQSSAYTRNMFGTSWGIFFQTNTYPAWIIGLKYTGLYNDTVRIPYILNGSQSAIDQKFAEANRLELMAGIKL